MDVRQEARDEILFLGIFENNLERHPCFLANWRPHGLGACNSRRFIFYHADCLRNLRSRKSDIESWGCRKFSDMQYASEPPSDYNIRLAKHHNCRLGAEALGVSLQQYLKTVMGKRATEYCNTLRVWNRRKTVLEEHVDKVSVCSEVSASESPSVPPLSLSALEVRDCFIVYPRRVNHYFYSKVMRPM